MNVMLLHTLLQQGILFIHLDVITISLFVFFKFLYVAPVIAILIIDCCHEMSYLYIYISLYCLYFIYEYYFHYD